MENQSPERKFEDKMERNFSIKALRNNQANIKLSLRKEKRNIDMLLNLKEKINIIYEQHYSIHLHLLKTNNDEIRNFSINIKNPKDSMSKLKYLLSSKDDYEVKYGLYAVRKFFQDLVRNLYKSLDPISNKITKEEIKTSSDYDIFINNNIINILIEVLSNNINNNEKSSHINIYEIIWIFINMANVNPQDESLKYEFLKTVLKQNNFNILINLINVNVPQEIIYNLLVFFINIIYEDERVFIEIFVKSKLTQMLMNYLKTNKKMNQEILIKIYKLLFSLYIGYDNLEIDAYKIMLKIFSLPLYIFQNKEILEYSLNMLNLLTRKKQPQINCCFNNPNLFSALYNIALDNPIESNEVIINYILDIFTNLIEANDMELQKTINSGSLLTFYNGLLIKHKNERIIKQFEIEKNIIVSINNLLMFGGIYVLKYIIGEGVEIMNFFMDSAKSVFKEMKLYGIKSLLNILINDYDYNIVDIKIIYDMVNIIIHTFNLIEFNNCFCCCTQIITMIIDKSEKMNFKNELKNYLNHKGFINFVNAFENQLLNNYKCILLQDDKSSIDEYLNIIDEIRFFLNN